MRTGVSYSHDAREPGVDLTRRERGAQLRVFRAAYLMREGCLPVPS